jgi:Double-GTPase 2
MSKICPFPDCYAPEVSCEFGATRYEDCEHWQSQLAPAAEGAEITSEPAEAEEIRFPWTGNAMGASDLGYLTGATRTRLVALAGPADAGKTSLLAAFYLLIARGWRGDRPSFAGSYTLEGWENIASSLRWSSVNGPTFPPHTSSAAGREPGLLHLSLRTRSTQQELLVADAPGEWFERWATNKDSAQAEGARWLSEHSDVFLVIADSVALAGAERGIARKSILDLLQRVGGEVRGRPVALVWTKSDATVSDGMVKTIREAAQRALPGHVEFHVSMHPSPVQDGKDEENQGQNVLALLEWIVTARAKSYSFTPETSPEKALLHTFGRAQ